MIGNLTPNGLKSWLRGILYRPKGVSMGVGSFIRRPFEISHPEKIFIGAWTTFERGAVIVPITNYARVASDPKIVIGDGVYFGIHAFIASINSVEICDGCVVSDYVYINDSSHGFDPQGGPIMEQPMQSRGPIKIGPYCFLGLRSVIMPGVTLGERCIVGANSVVTRSFPAYSVVGGVPAKLIKMQYPADVAQG